jgi:saccharopine dehydrogenase-like NADP-dependent oxidoreductase
MTSTPVATVFGAYGHTGRFIVTELRKRGWTPILSGRDANKLNALAAAHRGLEARLASIDSPETLDRALANASLVINCAGPFAVTSAPMIQAALRAKIPCLDVTAEAEIVAAAFDQYDGRARDAGILIAPAVGFYGGLGDLLATTAMGDWSSADEITLAYALNSWKPTLGTRATIQASIQRRAGHRVVFANHRFESRTDPAPTIDWVFPAPIGKQTVVTEFLTADSVTITRHLKAREIREVMTVAPLKDLSDPDLSPPPSIDASGRSTQTFLVEAVVRFKNQERRAVVSGRDIYAVTAPIVVEAAQRVLANPAKRFGVVSAGEIGDARTFLQSLSPDHLLFEA